MLSKPKDILSRILSPLSYDDFFDNIVGKKTIALLDDKAAKRAAMLGNSPQQIILDAFETLAPTLTCHAHAPTSPPPEARPVGNAEAFHDLLREYHAGGYTVRIPDANRLSPDLYRFTRALEVILENPVDTVIFWSDSGAAAPIHHDDYDIIAIQLVGQKKWFLSSEPPSLPNTWVRAGETPPTLSSFDVHDVSPGDLLYIPRGTAHTVQSTSESIHLSIGFVPVTARDAVNAMLDHHSDFDEPMRTGLLERADDLAHDRGKDDIGVKIRRHLEQLLAQCQSDAFISEALEQRKARMITDLPKLPPSPAENKITITSRVRHSDLAIAQMVTTEEFVDFSQPGNHILVHRGTEDGMRFITETPEFLVNEIPGDIDDDVRLALVNRLLGCGYLDAAV